MATRARSGCSDAPRGIWQADFQVFAEIALVAESELIRNRLEVFGGASGRREFGTGNPGIAAKVLEFSSSQRRRKLEGHLIGTGCGKLFLFAPQALRKSCGEQTLASSSSAGRIKRVAWH